MGFSLFKKAKLEIYTPVDGEIIPIGEVPDPVFNQKMIGEGMAVNPTGGDITSPVEGTIVQIAPTKHAIGIQAKEGTEILIHVGLETVALKGEGFKVAVNMNDKVSVGQKLLEVDWDYIRTHAASTITPVVITNSHDGDKKFSFTDEKQGVHGKTIMMTVSK